MEQCIDLAALRDVPRSDLPAALAAMALSKGERKAEFDPLFTALRSSSSDEALEIVKAEMGNPMVAALADLLDGADREARAALALSIIAGFDVSRHMIAPDALQPENDEILRPRLEAALRAALSVS